MKPTFLKYDKPLLTAMIYAAIPEDAISKIKASLADGAEAFCIQLELLKREYRSEENLKAIFSACNGKPIYVTSYRGGENEGFTDEQCMDFLLFALDCSATLCDIPGDMFDRSPHYELTTDPIAIKKQKELVAEIHRRGGEVLISSHTLKPLTVEENLKIARAQAERGADIIKIVNNHENAGDIPSCIESIQKIKASVDKELLFLVSGAGSIIRYIGANFGVCMYLCLQTHEGVANPVQPLLTKVKAVRDNINLNF